MRTDLLANATQPFLTDGGLETTLIFEDGFDLPCFASFTLLQSERGRDAMRSYFNRYIDIAAERGRGFVLDTTTWRAGTIWGAEMGYSPDEIRTINSDAVAFAAEIRDARQTPRLPILINGVIGPSGDGYSPDQELSAEASRLAHTPQIHALGKAGVDLVSAITMTQSGEAAGIAMVAREIDVPVVISYTVETDGRLPSGEEIGDAIAVVEEATDGYPLYFMINCAHPDHFRDAVAKGEAWTKRIGGIRANASRMSHAELDVAEELDPGNPEELGALHAELLTLLPNIRVLGGCCGTDHRHVGCIAGHSHIHIAA